MPDKPEKRTRKSPRNFQKEREKVITYCRVSLQVITQISGTAPENMKPFFNGQMDALKGVLREFGESEREGVSK